MVITPDRRTRRPQGPGLSEGRHVWVASSQRISLHTWEVPPQIVLGAGILVTFWNWFRSRRSGAPAGADPWHGETLEWAMPSPPPEYNFETIPTVRRAS